MIACLAVSNNFAKINNILIETNLFKIKLISKLIRFQIYSNYQLHHIISLNAKLQFQFNYTACEKKMNLKQREN